MNSICVPPTVRPYSYYNESCSDDVHESPQGRPEGTRKVQGCKLIVEAKDQVLFIPYMTINMTLYVISRSEISITKYLAIKTKNMMMYNHTNS